MDPKTREIFAILYFSGLISVGIGTFIVSGHCRKAFNAWGKDSFGSRLINARTAATVSNVAGILGWLVIIYVESALIGSIVILLGIAIKIFSLVGEYYAYDALYDGPLD